MALLFPLCSFAAERPILVSVGIASNGQAAGIGKRAPWGIHEADIVYEIMMYETGQTRLTCLFQSQFPETVGPVRSARMSQFYLREEWDAAFVFAVTQDCRPATGCSLIFRSPRRCCSTFIIASCFGCTLAGKKASRLRTI